MPSLQILKSPNPNQNSPISLDGDRFVIGRNPDCGIVIPVNSVSREHAQIVRVQGAFLIEDLQSRNGTFVNNQAITSRVPLKDNDRIRICDFLAVFKVETFTSEDDRGNESSSTTVEATLSHNSGNLLQTAPVEALRFLLEISANLSRTLDLDVLLPKIVDSLFQLFKQADRAFIILTAGGGEAPVKLMPKVIRTRRPQDEASARYSRGIVNKCLETAQAFLSDDASQDSRLQTSQSVVDFRIRSVMCAPVVNAEGKAFGIIQLDTQDRSKKFMKNDLEMLVGVANQASIALENVRMMQEAVQQERMKRDLSLAHEVQMSCLPQKLPEVAGYSFHSFYRPAYMVGGDYYDFIAVPPRRLVMLLGDVAGKGMPAALLVTKLTSEARFNFLHHDDVARSIGGLNDTLTPQCSMMDRFVTLAACVLDPATHVVKMGNAGHPSPLLFRAATKRIEKCIPEETSGFALGIMEGYPYESCQIKLEPGDTLLIFSDGVTDAENVNGEQFNDERVISTLQSVGSGSPKLLIDKLMQAIEKHTAGARQNDDITLVAMGRNA
jgi:serine phosphatase RsbU (regulator of sigma subunit)/pSer/pThr/pTyr-binding forkhead associated (FHA) protein